MLCVNKWHRKKDSFKCHVFFPSHYSLCQGWALFYDLASAHVRWLPMEFVLNCCCFPSIVWTNLITITILQSGGLLNDVEANSPEPMLRGLQFISTRNQQPPLMLRVNVCVCASEHVQLGNDYPTHTLSKKKGQRMQLAWLELNLKCLFHLWCCFFVFFFKYSLILCVHFHRSVVFDLFLGTTLKHQPWMTLLWPRSIYPLDKSQRPKGVTWFIWNCLCSGSFSVFLVSVFAVGSIFGIVW